MAWTKFVNTGGSFSPKISIRTNGQIGLSQGFLNRFDMDGDGWHIVLYHDHELRRIALEPTKDSSAPGAIKVLIRTVKSADGRTSKTAQLSAKSFLEFSRIQFRDRLHTYRASDDKDGNLIIVDLKNELTEKEPSV